LDISGGHLRGGERAEGAPVSGVASGHEGGALLVPGLHVGDQIHHAARVAELIVIPATGVAI